MSRLSWNRRERSAEESTEALRGGGEGRHPETASAENEPVSKLCEEFELQPTVFYRWQKELLDADVVAVAPASVWRVLHRAGLSGKWSRKPSAKGKASNSP